MVDSSSELLVNDCLDEALHIYPEIRRAFLADAEVREGFERMTEVLTAVAVVMQHEGVDALTAKRVIEGTWQVSMASTLSALAARGLALP